MKECDNFIKERGEARHFKTMVRQKSKPEVSLTDVATQTSYIAAGLTAHMKTTIITSKVAPKTVQI